MAAHRNRHRERAIMCIAYSGRLRGNVDRDHFATRVAIESGCNILCPVPAGSRQRRRPLVGSRSTAVVSFNRRRDVTGNVTFHDSIQRVKAMSVRLSRRFRSQPRSSARSVQLRRISSRIRCRVWFMARRAGSNPPSPLRPGITGHVTFPGKSTSSVHAVRLSALLVLFRPGARQSSCRSRARIQPVG